MVKGVYSIWEAPLEVSAYRRAAGQDTIGRDQRDDTVASPTMKRLRCLGALSITLLGVAVLVGFACGES